MEPPEAGTVYIAARTGDTRYTVTGPHPQPGYVLMKVEVRHDGTWRVSNPKTAFRVKEIAKNLENGTWRAEDRRTVTVNV